MDKIRNTLLQSRRHKETRLMHGLICLRYRDIGYVGANKFHAMNFLVGPDPQGQPTVLFIDACDEIKENRLVWIILLMYTQT